MDAMKHRRLDVLRDIIQEDVGQRGLAADPEHNLINACPEDFRRSCVSIAEQTHAAVAIVTDFIIPRAEPPCGETDGPLGALFLARALVPAGIRVAIISDPFGWRAMQAGLQACGLHDQVEHHVCDAALERDWAKFVQRFGLTHLVALERPGPSHTAATLAAQGVALAQLVDILPPEHQNCYHTMGGRDITPLMSPAHVLFEREMPGVVTIGIGDGGNEIGMGKIRWEVIKRNIPRGGLVACRIATDHLIVAGVSNWGAYGLASGIRLLRGYPAEQTPGLYDPAEDQRLLAIMVEKGPLVDGVTAQRTATVDGLTNEDYAKKLCAMGKA